MESRTPPTLVFDCNSDSFRDLHHRLHEKAPPGSQVRLIVHLKNGTTYVGELAYFDATRLRLEPLYGRPVELWIRDLAHVLALSGEVRV